MKEKTHVYRVWKYLNDVGSITSLDAIREFGNTRLSATIFELRNRYHLPIISQRECGTNRYGEKTEYVRYILQSKERVNTNE